TNQRLGKIPLVPGMPVVMTTNFDVQSGAVNGCVGILKQIRYYLDQQGRRHAVSCVIESDSIDGEPLPLLQKHQAVALEDSTEM
ncbi:hypothetical protein C8J56DRAFT_724369, partial [Mycena floridula]